MLLSCFLFLVYYPVFAIDHERDVIVDIFPPRTRHFFLCTLYMCLHILSSYWGRCNINRFLIVISLATEPCVIQKCLDSKKKIPGAPVPPCTSCLSNLVAFISTSPEYGTM